MTDFKQLKECITGRTPQLQAESDAIVDRMEMEEHAWIAQLRKDGYKAAHPNDGWVDREKQEVNLCYPQFNDGVEVGDKIMLGWPYHPEQGVPVRITEIRKGVYGGGPYYSYEKIPVPKQKDERGFFSRLFRRVSP